MPRRSLAGLGPNYQRRLDAPMNERFPLLKYTPVSYDRQLAVDEMYHHPSILYKIRFHFFKSHPYHLRIKLHGAPERMSNQWTMLGT